MHIKTIKGKKYYYESKRIGKKVTSVYIGPVDKMTKQEEHKEIAEQTETTEEEFYVG